MQNKMEYNLIIPLAKQDLNILKDNIQIINDRINPKKIVVIGCDGLENDVIGLLDTGKIDFINENDFISGLNYNSINNYLAQYSSSHRTGWYFQQFLKLGYSLICKEEYYISWDADTIPLRNMDFFMDKNPIFDVKDEYNADYFDTIDNLFGLKKQGNFSFISEHMVFNASIVQEMLEKIEQQTNKKWWLAILDSINREALGKSGFSEFETYGTYVMNCYPDLYKIKSIKAIRCGKRIFGNIPKRSVCDWLGKSYYSMSFEKWDKNYYSPKLSDNKVFRLIIHPALYVNYCLFIVKVKRAFNRDK